MQATKRECERKTKKTLLTNATFRASLSSLADRAAQYRANGCVQVITVLIGPRKYIGDNKFGFDETIYYEDLVEWLNAGEALGDRRVCKLALLKAAIEKCEEIAPVKDPRSVAFFNEYYQVLRMSAPELRIVDEPKDGGFLYFHPANLPKYLNLMHRVRQGYVDLQFRGMADRVDQLRSTFSTVLPRDFEVRRVGGSAAIGVAVPTLNRKDEFEKQRKEVEIGIRELTRLWEWFLDNRDRWEQNNRMETE